MTKHVVGALLLFGVLAWIMWTFLISTPAQDLEGVRDPSSLRGDGVTSRSDFQDLPSSSDSPSGRESASIVAKVISTDGDALPGAVVTLERAVGDSDTLEADVDGTVRFDPRGVRLATASFPGLVSSILKFENDPDEALFRLGVPGSIVITLLDPFDQPVEGVDILIRRVLDNASKYVPVHSGLSGANGELRVDGLPPGVYDCRLKSIDPIELESIGSVIPGRASAAGSVPTGCVVCSDDFTVGPRQEVRLSGRAYEPISVAGQLSIPNGVLVEVDIRLFEIGDEKEFTSTEKASNRGHFEVWGRFGTGPLELRARAIVQVGGVLNHYRFQREYSLGSVKGLDLGLISPMTGLSAAGIVQLQSSDGEDLAIEDLFDEEEGGELPSSRVTLVFSDGSASGKSYSAVRIVGGASHQTESKDGPSRRVHVELNVPFVVHGVPSQSGTMLAAQFRARSQFASVVAATSSWEPESTSVEFNLDESGFEVIPLRLRRVGSIVVLFPPEDTRDLSHDGQRFEFRSRSRSSSCSIVALTRDGERIDTQDVSPVAGTSVVYSAQSDGFLTETRVLQVPFGEVRLMALSGGDSAESFFFETSFVHRVGVPVEIQVEYLPAAELIFESDHTMIGGRIPPFRMFCKERNFSFKPVRLASAGLLRFVDLPPHTTLVMKPGGRTVTTPGPGESLTVNPDLDQ